jgi:DNA-binding transcriptional LysR family regulator
MIASYIGFMALSFVTSASYASDPRARSRRARNGLFPPRNEWHHRAVDRIQCMQVFVRVAQHLGFAAAARDLGMSQAAVSKHVSALEAHMGTRLFDRTTRRVALTEAGRVYLERCIECLQALDDADAALGELAKAPGGRLRVTAPLDCRDMLVPVVAQAMAAHPQLTVDLRLSNRVVDLVEEGVDVALRVAHSLDGRYVARSLARTHLVVLGAPGYLRRHGKPRVPQDLAEHRNVVFTEPRPIDEIGFRRDGQEVRVKLNGVMTSNDGASLMAAACEGIGLALAPTFLAHPYVADGRLEPLLTDWTLPSFTLFAVYPHRRFLSPKVRAFLEALVARFPEDNADPWGT